MPPPIVVDAKPMLVVDATQTMPVVDGKEMLVVEGALMHEAVVSDVAEEAEGMIGKLEDKGLHRCMW